MYFYLISVFCCLFSISCVSARVLEFVTENAPPLQYIDNGKVVGKTTALCISFLLDSNLT